MIRENLSKYETVRNKGIENDLENYVESNELCSSRQTRIWKGYKNCYELLYYHYSLNPDRLNYLEICTWRLPELFPKSSNAWRDGSANSLIKIEFL